MKKYFLIILLSIQPFFLKEVYPQGTTDEEKWYAPNHLTLQFAGNIGVVSVGTGYEFFKGKLTSNLFFGYVPSSVAKATIFTLAQKNSFRGKNFKSGIFKRIYPLAGFSVNMETGNNSFIFVPEKYPAGYYAPQAFTFSLFSGLTYQGKIYNRSIIKQINYYCEIGTLATYLFYNIKNKEYLNPNIWSIALGIKIKFRPH